MDWEVRFHDRRQAIACVVLMMATGLPCRGRAADAATEAELRSLQWDLVWTGHYEATVDGQPGPTTRRAIRSYQASIGHAADGDLSTEQRDRLAARAAAMRAFVGWTIYENPAAGYRIGYPAAILPMAQARGPYSQQFYSDDASAVLATIVTGPDSAESLRATYDRLLADKAHRVVYRIWKPTWFVVSYVIDESGYYVMFRRRQAATVSYVLRWPKAEDQFFRPIATAIFNSFTVPDDVAR